MSDNWVVQNLENALETWNEKLSEIWTLITTTPQNFKGGNIWRIIYHGAVVHSDNDSVWTIFQLLLLPPVTILRL